MQFLSCPLHVGTLGIAPPMPKEGQMFHLPAGNLGLASFVSAHWQARESFVNGRDMDSLKTAIFEIVTKSHRVPRPLSPMRCFTDRSCWIRPPISISGPSLTRDGLARRRSVGTAKRTTSEMQLKVYRDFQHGREISLQPVLECDAANWRTFSESTPMLARGRT